MNDRLARRIAEVPILATALIVGTALVVGDVRRGIVAVLGVVLVSKAIGWVVDQRTQHSEGSA